MKNITALAILISICACQSGTVSEVPIEEEVDASKNLISGKLLFNEHCSACHHATTTLVGPPFQRIRNDYGLQWTLNFVRDSEKMIYEQKDTAARYIFSLWRKSVMPKFETLTDGKIVDILDYVDSFDYDPDKYQRRKVPNKVKQQIVDEYEKELADKLNEALESIKNFKKAE